MRFPTSLARAMLLLALTTSVQVATAPAGLGPPIMHLSAQASIKMAPDDVVVDLTAAAVQRGVNEMIAKAKAAGTPGVRTTFRDNAVFYSAENPPHWTSRQTLEGRGGNAEPVLDMVGRQQALGVAIPAQAP